MLVMVEFLLSHQVLCLGKAE